MESGIDRESFVELFALTKGVFGLVKQQQARLDAIGRNHDRLFSILRDVCGLPEDDDAVPAAPDSDAVAKMESGLAELERMFNLPEADDVERENVPRPLSDDA